MLRSRSSRANKNKYDFDHPRSAEHGISFDPSGKAEVRCVLVLARNLVSLLFKGDESVHDFEFILHSFFDDIFQTYDLISRFIKLSPHTTITYVAIEVDVDFLEFMANRYFKSAFNLSAR